MKKFLAIFAVLLCLPVSAMAYTRTPSGTPVNDGFAVHLDTGTDVSSNCSGGFTSVAFYDGISLERITPFQADAATLDFSVMCSSSYDWPPGTAAVCDPGTFPVAQTLVLCSSSGDPTSGDWSSYDLSDSFDWVIPAGSSSSSASTTFPTTLDEPNADVFYGVVVFFLAAFFITFLLTNKKV